MDFKSIKKHIFSNLTQYVPHVIAEIIYEYYGKIINSLSLDRMVSTKGDIFVGITDNHAFFKNNFLEEDRLYQINLKTNKEDEIKLEGFSSKNIQFMIEHDLKYYILYQSQTNGLLVFDSDFKFSHQFSLGQIKRGLSMLIINDIIYVYGLSGELHDIIIMVDMKTKNIVKSIILPELSDFINHLEYINDQLYVFDEYSNNILIVSRDLTTIEKQEMSCKNTGHSKLFINNQRFIINKNSVLVDCYNSLVVCEHNYFSRAISRICYHNNKVYFAYSLSHYFFIFNVNYL